MSKKMKDLQDKVNAAAKFEHPERLVRLTLECAHLRLEQFQNCMPGTSIGWSTTCNICGVSRAIVNQEETGVL